MPITIYALVDPRSEEIRYIGKTDNIRRRHREHLIEKRNLAKAAWTKELADKGLTPRFITLEECDVNGWQDCERKWVKIGHESDWHLFNRDEGGLGSPDGHHSMQFVEPYLEELDRGKFRALPYRVRFDMLMLAMEGLMPYFKEGVAAVVARQHEKARGALKKGESNLRYALAEAMAATQEGSSCLN